MGTRRLKCVAAVSAALTLAYCGSNDVTPNPPTTPVPGVSSAVTFSFDLGVVDPATHKYYVTDRTNKAIDTWDPATGLVTQFKNSGYGGCNSGGNTGGSTNVPYIPMPGCLSIPNTGIFFPNPTSLGGNGTAVFVAGTLVTNNDLDGPDGLDIVGGALYAGDVNHLWVINKAAGTVAGSVAIPNTGLKQGFRSDEGCFDATHHLYAIALTGDPNTPLYTVLDTTGAEDGVGIPTVLGFVLMNGPDSAPAGGLEACAFDTRATTVGAGNTMGMMWLNNDGSTTNGHGEMDGIPIEDLVAMRTTPLAGNKMVVFQGLAAGPFVQFNSASTAAAQCVLGGGGGCGPTLPKVYPLPANCDPTGLALGPATGSQVGAMCRPVAGLRMDFVILDGTAATNATAVPANIVATVAGGGGGDQITYDATSKKWYLGTSRHTPNGISCAGGTAVTCPLTPAIGVVDGTTFALSFMSSGNNSHSIAVDGPAGRVFSPFTNSSASGGGQLFPGGGLLIFPTQ
jgi:hypothetical protein